MADIVERLYGDGAHSYALRLEAADEIERLRQICEDRLRVCKDKTALLTDAYAQIERLREENDQLNALMAAQPQSHLGER